MSESAEILVIGGGQAGLTAGYYLAQSELPFRILNAESRPAHESDELGGSLGSNLADNACWPQGHYVRRDWRLGLPLGC